ncbi:TetR/AcrR family transcriptional regulator [Nocardioides sp. Bht2]|uniref:TetR/AcrR family transcriptional regulator n=1 Tax=Nocardioides sp. Bht2 TaxID=3392297 RepID=UPI0039B66F41
MTRGQLARRARLTTAVIELLEEVSPEQLQVKQVTERSLVSLGAVYRYFSGKDHLLAASLTDWYGSFASQVEREYADGKVETALVPANLPARERVSRFVHLQMHSFYRHPHFARLMTFVYASADPYASKEIARVTEENRRMVVTLIGDRPGNQTHAMARAISSTMSLSVMHWQGGRATYDDVVHDVDSVIDLVFGQADQ